MEPRSRGPVERPVFGDGIVAVADRNGVLHGVEATTGVERWHTPPIVNMTAPVLADGIVYITGTDHEPMASISRPASNGGRGRPRPI